jgi:hypothetical protein
MKTKWKILIMFVILYSIELVGAAWHTAGSSTDPTKAVPTVEA